MVINMGKIQCAVSLIREYLSKIPSFNVSVLFHSVYVPL